MSGSSCFIREVSWSLCFVREGLRRVAGVFPSCTYTCRHHPGYVGIYVQAWSRLCVHIRTGMIAAVCAYTCRHDRAYVCTDDSKHTSWSWNHIFAHTYVALRRDYETHRHRRIHASRFRMMVRLRLIRTKTSASLRQHGCVKVFVSYAHTHTRASSSAHNASTRLNVLYFSLKQWDEFLDT